MIVKYISEENINVLRNNIKSAYNQINMNGEIDSEKLFERSEVFHTTRISCNDFTLVEKESKSKEAELENIKRVYSNLIHLSPSQASDERIWSALAMSTFLSYMKNRWPLKNEKVILNRYLFGYSPKRSLYRHGLSRLWWIGYMTHDVNRDNPYELTELLISNSDFVEQIFGRSFSNNRKLLHALLDVLNELIKEDMEIKRNTVRELSEYVIQLGGIYLIDSLEYVELKSKIKFYAENRLM